MGVMHGPSSPPDTEFQNIATSLRGPPSPSEPQLSDGGATVPRDNVQKPRPPRTELPVLGHLASVWKGWARLHMPTLRMTQRD